MTPVVQPEAISPLNLRAAPEQAVFPPPRFFGREVVIELRWNRSMGMALLLSVILHVAVLFFLKSELLTQGQQTPQSQPITVRLNSPAHPKAVPEPPLPPVEIPKVNPPKPRKPEVHPMPHVMTTEQLGPRPLPAVPAPVQPPAVQPSPASPPMDMMSYVNAARERRRQSEEGAARENAGAAARERAPSEDEVRNEIIKRNLQQGTNGLFQIVNMGPHSAQFVFKGWISDYSTARREFFQVEAGMDEDIQRNVVRKMIAIIRRHYSGDFNWESPRLGRVVVLSARREDNDGLEDFLITEFFGSGY